MSDTPEEGSEHDATRADVRPGRDVSEARVAPLPEGLPRQLGPLLEAAIPQLVARVTSRVQTEIPHYAGPTAGRRRRLINLAVAESAAHFVRQLQGRKASTAGVDELFRRMGHGEATEGHGLTALQTALQIATREAWGALRDVTVGAELSAGVLGRLGDELVAFMDHLDDQLRTGHAMAHRAADRDAHVQRARLMTALLDGLTEAEVRTRAELAGWPLPSRLVVLTAAAPELPAWHVTDELRPKALLDAGADPAVVIADADHVADVVARLRADVADVRVALGWPVALEDVRHAHRWTVRALELAESGVIPRQPVIDCSRHRTQLWLHAEPALRRQLAQELLKPLFAETPNSREILSETLLVWLETRDSAPAIAAKLGVHPQTVRYRWKRINELFGEDLHDSEFVVQLTMVLKASVPLWVAGDQSDFERYWTGAAR